MQSYRNPVQPKKRRHSNTYPRDIARIDALPECILYLCGAGKRPSPLGMLYNCSIKWSETYLYTRNVHSSTNRELCPAVCVIINFLPSDRLQSVIVFGSRTPFQESLQIEILYKIKSIK